MEKKDTAQNEHHLSRPSLVVGESVVQSGLSLTVRHHPGFLHRSSRPFRHSSTVHTPPSKGCTCNQCLTQLRAHNKHGNITASSQMLVTATIIIFLLSHKPEIVKNISCSPIHRLLKYHYFQKEKQIHTYSVLSPAPRFNPHPQFGKHQSSSSRHFSRCYSQSSLFLHKFISTVAVPLLPHFSENSELNHFSHVPDSALCSQFAKTVELVPTSLYSFSHLGVHPLKSTAPNHSVLEALVYCIPSHYCIRVTFNDSSSSCISWSIGIFASQRSASQNCLIRVSLDSQ